MIELRYGNYDIIGEMIIGTKGSYEHYNACLRFAKGIKTEGSLGLLQRIEGARKVSR